MSAKTLSLKIISPEEPVLSEEVVSVVIPGQDGLFGVLPRHATMVALTESGMLTARKPDGQKLEFLIHDGFAEVRRDEVRVLTSAAERPDQIDLERARHAAERARERLRVRQSEYDYARTLASLRRAMARERRATKQRG